MNKYKYQLHCHTTPCSACSSMTPSELVEGLVNGGFNGCVITNHFYNGNSGINRNLPWNDFVYQYEKDYLECKKLAANYNLDIIFGIEEGIVDGLEILCYGITPEFLYNNPQLRANRSIFDWYTALNKIGALCVQAHPYRDRAYINNPRPLPPDMIHGIEIYNYSNNANDNFLAEQFSIDYPNLILTSGADAHSANLVDKAGIETDVRICNEQVLIYVLKSKNYTLIK